jgi:GNAT superfamily N-acetyltransferase
MLIYERSVTKPFWQVIENYINRRLQTARFTPVGETGVMNIFGGDTSTTYAILKHGKPVAWLYLGRRPRWKTWEVRQVWVFPEYRGKGLAGKLYRAAVNAHGITLASGKTQSKSSRALWHSFVQKGTFNIWAHDFNNLNHRSQVWLDDDDLQSELQIYTRQPSRQDVRLIAIRR